MTNESKTQLTPPLKWHGGKSYLADWIIDLMPKHLHYVEPFGGGLAVLLAKDPFDQRHQWSEKSFEKGISEVVNDLNRELMNFWRVLQDEESFRRFQRIVEATPFAQPQWDDAGTRMLPRHEVDIEAAVAFLVRCRQSRAGGFKGFATLSRNRTRRLMNEQASAWLSCIEGLADVHDRLKRVVVLCDNALKVIKQQDGANADRYNSPLGHVIHSPVARLGPPSLYRVPLSGAAPNICPQKKPICPAVRKSRSSDKNAFNPLEPAQAKISGPDSCLSFVCS